MALEGFFSYNIHLFLLMILLMLKHYGSFAVSVIQSGDNKADIAMPMTADVTHEEASQILIKCTLFSMHSCMADSL